MCTPICTSCLESNAPSPITRIKEHLVTMTFMVRTPFFAFTLCKLPHSNVEEENHLNLTLILLQPSNSRPVYS
ncbi:hypothetical protein L1987_84955 [Smallanthus sonchifolius]|uniref:Uncharacterized protein n=1 Tax=Smallanthus sonchifolius TaxID=185202 RepID=A0ACB8XW82_9ASTR|nr:hypothetical protein L1987_84955 [Smallanthus sonchifolius]